MAPNKLMIGFEEERDLSGIFKLASQSLETDPNFKMNHKLAVQAPS